MAILLLLALSSPVVLFFVGLAQLYS